MTAVWFLAWVGSVVLGGVLVGELWIRLRDNYRREPIDLDEMDRPTGLEEFGDVPPHPKPLTPGETNAH